jgi:hypothetical protein
MKGDKEKNLEREADEIMRRIRMHFLNLLKDPLNSWILQIILV